MRKIQSMLVMLAAAFLSSLLLTLMGGGRESGQSPALLHAQEQPPSDAIAVDASTSPGHNVELVGHINGDFSAVAVQGNYAYAGMGINFVVVDISQPAMPTVVASLSLPAALSDINIQNDYAYIADREAGLRVVDVGDPTTPVEVGFYSMPSVSASKVAVVGSYAYVATIIGGLQIVDVSDPTNPVQVGFIDIPWATSVAVAGEYAYVGDYGTGLLVVDVSDPSAPEQVGVYDTYPTLGIPWHVAVAGGYVYLNTYNWSTDLSELRVVDVGDPTAPVEIGHINIPGYASGVVVDDGYAYVPYIAGPQRGGLRVVDVGDPTMPVNVGHYDTLGDSNSVAVTNGYVYVTSGDGLFILRYAPTSYPALGRATNWDGAPLPGVGVSVSPTQTALTDWAGNYILSGLVTGTYTITPSRDGFFFEPPSRTFSVPPLARQQDFTVSSAPIYAIDGGIYKSSLNAPVVFSEPVSLQLSTGESTTAHDGLYSFANLPPGTYVVTPTLADHIFHPPSREITIPPSRDDLDFIVVKNPTLNILGTVRQSNGEPFAGVQVQFSQISTTTRALLRGAALLSTELGISSAPSTTTDAKGRYAFLNLEPGLYAVTAHLDGYVLLPVSRTANLPTLNEYPFTVLPGPVTGTLTSGVTMTLTLTDTQGLTTTLAFPPDAIPAGTQVTVTPVQMPSFPGHVPVHHALELAVSSSAGRVPVLDFTQPVSVSVRYSVTDTRSISDTAGIRLWWLTEGEWLEAGQSCAPPPGQSHDEPTRVVHAIICRPGLYALAGPTYQWFVPWVVR
jgi:hypothetical protein